MLIATQFLGALNENGLKQLIVFLVLATGLKQVERDQLVLVVGALFAVPYILVFDGRRVFGRPLQ